MTRCFSFTRVRKKREVAKRWRDLSSQNHWKGMLQPLDQDLRQYIIHYGEMTQVRYDTFNKVIVVTLNKITNLP